MTVVDDPETVELSAEEASALGQKGRRWSEVHSDALAKLAAGTTVIINVDTGEYVSASSWFEALEQYQRRFGNDGPFGWSFEVGRPIFVGGGLWGG